MAAKKAKPLPVGKGKLGFTVSNTYSASPAKIWDAITKARHIQRFFVDKVAGDFTPKLAPVIFTWNDYGSYTLWPTRFQKGKKLEFRWTNHQGTYLTTVTFVLKRKGKLTGFEISERGWKPGHLKNAFDNCSGWSSFQDYLKAYLLKRLDLHTRTA